MRKTKTYDYTRFNAIVVQEALNLWAAELSGESRTLTRSIVENDERRELDSDEEFFAAFRRPFTTAGLTKKGPNESTFAITAHDWYCMVSIELSTRTSIERVFDVFERNAQASSIPQAAVAAPEPLTIFIGHGRSGVWRDLKDHPTDQQGYKVTAYEVGPRAGHYY
jgi:hypothetical protein